MVSRKSGDQEGKTFYRRRLPHYQPPGATFFVTYRLAGSLPTEVIVRLKEEREESKRRIRAAKSDVERKKLLYEETRRYFGRFDAFLDAATTGPKWLNQPEVATIVREAIHYRDGKQYDLYAYTIMPNHVHMVFDVERNDISHNNVGRPDWSPYKGLNRGKSAPYRVTRILEGLKWFTALRANEVLSRSGAFWQHESYDHVVRDGTELERIVWYVLNNPVKAGLCNDWKKWKWTYLKPDLM